MELLPSNVAFGGALQRVRCKAGFRPQAVLTPGTRAARHAMKGTAPLPLRKRGVTLHTADLHTVLNVEVSPSLFLSVEMFGMETPSPLCLFRLKFHDGHSFAVLRDKALV